jgi:microcompartment protein CcmK/EutM
MNRGVVVGEVWATRQCRSLVGKKLVLVDLWRQGESTGEVVVATDTLDANEGDRVLVTYGSGARNLFAPGPDNRHVLCDAAIAQIVDDEG